jgi:arylsulfatase A-like enzyme
MAHPFNGEGVARVANPNPSAELADRIRALYDGEITYLDVQLGVLFDSLKKRGLYDKTLIVLTADHGEEFQEHGSWWHGTTLYDEQTHVPLLMKPAGGGVRGRVVEDLVSSIDILPTIATAAKAPIPPLAQGQALSLGDAAPPTRDSVFSESDLEGNVLQAVRTRDWKYIKANPGNPRGLQPEELYDLGKDPKERANLATAQAQQKLVMEANLGKSFTEARKHAGAVTQTNVDEATRSRLEALGYMEKK